MGSKINPKLSKTVLVFKLCALRSAAYNSGARQCDDNCNDAEAAIYDIVNYVYPHPHPKNRRGDHE